MIQDHGETTRKLAAATAQAGLKPPPMAVGAAQSPLLAALQSAQGAAFDPMYWEQQALAHRAALVTQQNYATTGDTPAIRAVAQAAIPVVQSHLAMAEQMMKAAKPAG
jgi:putative membrane protein